MEKHNPSYLELPRVTFSHSEAHGKGRSRDIRDGRCSPPTTAKRTSDLALPTLLIPACAAAHPPPCVLCAAYARAPSTVWPRRPRDYLASLRMALFADPVRWWTVKVTNRRRPTAADQPHRRQLHGLLKLSVLTSTTCRPLVFDGESATAHCQPHRSSPSPPPVRTPCSSPHASHSLPPLPPRSPPPLTLPLAGSRLALFGSYGATARSRARARATADG